MAKKATHDSRKKRAMSSGQSEKVRFIPISGRTKEKLGEVLPISRPVYKPTTEQDWRKVEPPPRFEVKPPKGAPNVVIVLMDQSCYADPTGMGGPINTPTFDRLAANGLTYTNFHVNALCSPTPDGAADRAQPAPVQHGRRRGHGTAYPGDTGVRPQTHHHDRRDPAELGLLHVATSASATRSPDYEVNVSGPFDRWPTHTGFDKFYGYLAGEQSCSTRT